jgi:hypothetical protein
MNSSDYKITFSPAECWKYCEDEHCPYHHHDSWEYRGYHYRTSEEAVAAKKADFPEDYSEDSP